MKVLVDGENLRHQIAHILCAHKKITHKNNHFGFNLADFLAEVLGQDDLEITYYTTKIRSPKTKIPLKLKKQIEAISASNRKWIADLTNQGVAVEKAGYLRVRESSACIHCGKKTLVLQEKGVDVRVATDLVLTKDSDKQVTLISSDSDLAPAMEAAKRAGVHIKYVCYSAWLNRSVAAQAHKTITFDDALVVKHYKGIH